MKGPGIGDDCRGLAVVLGVIRALDAGKVQTPGTITFVGTVGEEGLGDLRGVKHLFNTELKGKIDRFVSVDGTGYGITHIGVGSKRYRVTFKGPGGHSYGAFGRVNPIHALGRAIDAISEFQVPGDPKTTFNVGRIGGGTSVNSIPFEAWMEVDMRSIDAKSLAEVDAEIQEGDRRGAGGGKEALGQGRSDRRSEAGGRSPGRPHAGRFADRAGRGVGDEGAGPAGDARRGSTDANVGMNLNIPAITIDGGGKGTDAHALTESFDSTDSWKGTQRALLVAIALAQPYRRFLLISIQGRGTNRSSNRRTA